MSLILSLVNTILITGIILVSLYHFYKMSNLKTHITDIEKKFNRFATDNKDINDIKSNILNKSLNLLDMDEFKHLDKDLKALYKKEIVNVILPKVMDEINKNIDKKQVLKFMNENANKIAKSLIELEEKYVNETHE